MTLPLTPAFFWATVGSLLLLPSFDLGAGLPSLRLDDALPLIWIAAIAPFQRWSLTRAVVARATLLGLFVVLISISVTNGILAGLGGSLADANQFVRLAKYLATYLLAATYFQESRAPLWSVSWLAVPLLLISASQFVNLLGLNEFYVPYVAPTQYQTLVDDYPYPRPVGMVGNPNELGFLFALLSLNALWGFLRQSGPGALSLAVIALLGTVISSSRTALVALVVGATVMVIAHEVAKGRAARALCAIVAALSTGAAALMIPAVYQRFTWRFATLLDFTSQASWQVRLSNWRENLTLALDHPILGVGPLRRVAFEHAADNEWLLLLRSYGLAGIVLVVLILALPTLWHFQRALALGVVTATIIYMVPAAAFHSLTIFPLLLMALAYADVDRKKVLSP